MRESEIQVGKIYWAGRPGFESRVRVVRKAETVDGWWVCEEVDSHMDRLVPTSVFQRMVRESRESGKQ